MEGQMANLSLRKTAIAITASAAIVLPPLSPASYAKDARPAIPPTKCVSGAKNELACLKREIKEIEARTAKYRKGIAAAKARGAAADAQRIAAEDNVKCVRRIKEFPLELRQKVIAAAKAEAGSEAGAIALLERKACEYAVIAHPGSVTRGLAGAFGRG
jgi:septal ring factor EnvC (AmiA/AmiB activator)